jgi:hypothetical protein
MQLILLPLGVLVLVATTVDLFATVSQPGRHGGFLATRLVDVFWQGALRLHRTWPSHRRLAAAGTACVVSMPLCWMTGMWLGWSLVFTSADPAVVDARTGDPAGTTARIYYAGYSLFTSGLGDKLPGGGWWEIATVLATAMGLGLVTLAITYLVPVVQAGTARRSVARQITRLGSTPEGIVGRSWRPPEITVLAHAATELLPRFELLTEQHLTYPVLHYLHSIDVATAFAPRVAALHDAMLLTRAEHASNDERLRFELLREAIADLANTFPIEEDLSEDALDLPPLREDRAATAVDDRSEERRRLQTLVRRDGWDWSAVTRPGS